MDSAYILFNSACVLLSMLYLDPCTLLMDPWTWVGTVGGGLRLEWLGGKWRTDQGRAHFHMLRCECGAAAAPNFRQGVGAEREKRHALLVSRTVRPSSWHGEPRVQRVRMHIMSCSGLFEAGEAGDR